MSSLSTILANTPRINYNKITDNKVRGVTSDKRSKIKCKGK